MVFGAVLVERSPPVPSQAAGVGSGRPGQSRTAAAAAAGTAAGSARRASPRAPGNRRAVDGLAVAKRVRDRPALGRRRTRRRRRRRRCGGAGGGDGGGGPRRARGERVGAVDLHLAQAHWSVGHVVVGVVVVREDAGIQRSHPMRRKLEHNVVVPVGELGGEVGHADPNPPLRRADGRVVRNPAVLKRQRLRAGDATELRPHLVGRRCECIGARVVCDGLDLEWTFDDCVFDAIPPGRR